MRFRVSVHFSPRKYGDPISSIAFSPDGQILASGSDDKTVKLWEISEGKCLKTLKGHNGWTRTVTFSPDGQFSASGNDDRTVRIWHVETGECIKTLQGHTAWVSSVAFSPNGKILASSSEAETIRLWKISTGECGVLVVIDHLNCSDIFALG